MGDRISPKSFVVPEETWLETLAQISLPTSSGDTRQRLWVTVDTAPLMLNATPFRVQVRERLIHLLLPPQSPDDPPQIEILVSLPEPGFAVYEKRVNEKGQIRLSMHYPTNLQVGYRVRIRVQVVIATSEEFLNVADSEFLVQ